MDKIRPTTADELSAIGFKLKQILLDGSCKHAVFLGRYVPDFTADKDVTINCIQTAMVNNLI